MLLEGKVALVTGAGRGIGRAISETLSREGAAVAINYSTSAAKAEAEAARIVDAGGRAFAVQADVRDPEQVDRMVAAVMERFGRIDGLVNNAIAGKQMGPLSDSTNDEYRNAFDYGCIAVLNTIRAVRPIMNRQGGGRIVNIVTEIWNFAGPEWSVYMAGKGAMVGVSRSLAQELGPENITVNMVAPGWMVDEKIDPTSDGPSGYIQSVPLKRQGSALEIGNACVFLMSDLASFVSGAYIPVTGGRVNQAGM